MNLNTPSAWASTQSLYSLSVIAFWVNGRPSVIRRSVQKVTSPEKKYRFVARDALAMHAKGVLKSGSGLAAPIGQGLENGKRGKHGKSW